MRSIMGPAETRIVSQEDATLAAVTEALNTGNILHFACHGVADLTEPLNSRLILANDEPLTLAALSRSAGPLRRQHVRLAVLSTCESQLPGLRLPDEVISLPAAMLQAGAIGIIASQWPVSGLATALLMTRFYSAWRADDQEPTEALHTAQEWLRDTTNAEKAATLDPRQLNSRIAAEALRPLWREIIRKPPDERSFAHVSDWGAFSYIGV